jgi:branched-chain amino acid transport system permease protein
VDFYISALLIYFVLGVLSAWSLNLQFGFAGVPNFAYYVFVAVGAYVAAATSIGPGTAAQSQQTYVLGASLPFPVPLLAGAAAGGVLALVIGTFGLRNLREDYQAAVMFIVAIMAVDVISSDKGVFNGANGLAGVQQPLSSVLNLSATNYQWAYLGWVAFIAAGVYLLVQRLSRSSWGRSLRAARDQRSAAASLGLNPTVLRLQVFVVGGLIAGLTGGLLVEFIGAWSPAAWGYGETFVVLVSLIVGGIENNRGAIVGTFLIATLFTELPTFLPPFGYPGLVDYLVWIIIGLIWITFLALRPRGVLPARRFVATPIGTDGSMATAGTSEPASAEGEGPVVDQPVAAGELSDGEER